MQIILILLILKTAESAFKRRVPYFEDKKTDEKWYWDDDDTKMKVMKEPNDRNAVYVSFDETTEELSIGYSKCLALDNDKSLKIVSKTEGCEKFTYKFETLKIANSDVNSQEVCLRANPANENYKLVRVHDCDNYKLYFEKVFRVSYKLYINEEDKEKEKEKENGQVTDKPDNEIMTTANSLTLTGQTIIITGQKRTEPTTIKNSNPKEIGTADSVYTGPSSSDFDANLLTTQGYSGSNSNPNSLTSTGQTKVITGQEPTETSTIKNSNPREIGTTDSVYTESSSSDVDENVITTQDYNGSSAFSTTTKSSKSLPSSSPGIPKSSKSASFVQDISSSPGPSVTQTQRVRTDSSTPSNKNKNSNMGSEFKDRAQPSASSNYVLKGYYINECILRQIENIEDTECFMECLNISFCRSFTHSNKNRCIIYSCLIDNMKQKKVYTINENHAYYK